MGQGMERNWGLHTAGCYIFGTILKKEGDFIGSKKTHFLYLEYKSRAFRKEKKKEKRKQTMELDYLFLFFFSPSPPFSFLPFPQANTKTPKPSTPKKSFFPLHFEKIIESKKYAHPHTNTYIMSPLQNIYKSSKLLFVWFFFKKRKDGGNDQIEALCLKQRYHKYP